MGHLSFLKQEYRDLVDRLGKGPVALPDPEDPSAREGLRELLEILFTPEDAALAARLPVMPSTLAKIARRLGTTPEALGPRLERLAERGLVVDLVPSRGETLWMLAPPVVGFFEYSLMRAHDRLPQRRLAEAMERYVSAGAFHHEVFDTETVLGRTLVHEDTVGEEDLAEVLDWERATALVEQARDVAVSLCMCRHKAEHLGERCDFPMESCLSLGSGARWVVQRGLGRPIDRHEALDLLAAARERGLVQLADNVQRHVTWLCNCCGCCCEQLRAITRYDLRAVVPSRFVAERDEARCVGCSRCARACPVAAITMQPVRVASQRKNAIVAAIDAERCIGCGVCVHACSKHANRMAPRAVTPSVPENAVAYAVRRAIERGRLADLLFDEGQSRGARFLNRAVRALTQLPGVERALASEQVRSRFVRYALSRVKL